LGAAGARAARTGLKKGRDRPSGRAAYLPNFAKRARLRA
jgi:hypothetical protein